MKSIKAKRTRFFSIILSIIIITVIPFAFYFENNLFNWLGQQWELGRQFDHEPVELILAVLYGFVSIPFILITIWTSINPLNKITKFRWLFWILTVLTIVYSIIGIGLDIFYYYYTHPVNW